MEHEHAKSADLHAIRFGPRETAQSRVEIDYQKNTIMHTDFHTQKTLCRGPGGIRVASEREKNLPYISRPDSRMHALQKFCSSAKSLAAPTRTPPRVLQQINTFTHPTQPPSHILLLSSQTSKKVHGTLPGPSKQQKRVASTPKKRSRGRRSTPSLAIRSSKIGTTAEA